VTLPLASYGVLLALALLTAAGFTLHACVRAQLDAGATIAALGCATLGGFAGATLLHAAVGGMRGLPLMAALSQPGLVFYGAALGAYAAFALAAARLGLSVGLALDLAAPVLPLGHALGRVGCFLAGCCFGAPHAGACAVTYTHPLAPATGASPQLVARHPWPLYEAALLLVLALALRLLPVRSSAAGRRFASYVVAYAVMRFVLEPLRGDTLRGALYGLSTSQLLAGLTLALALPFAVRRARCT
jgi:phosphatidylglycerol---prolipoprotein diacylglyceryl transferase